MLEVELHAALLDVASAARREKVPGPLARTMHDVGNKMLDLCQRDERAAGRFATLVAGQFATLVLSGQTNLRETTGQLPENTARACWRLIRLLEYLSNGR